MSPDRKKMAREIRRAYESVLDKSAAVPNAGFGLTVCGTPFLLKGLAGEVGGPIRFFLLRTVGKPGGFVRVERSAGSSLVPDRESFQEGMKNLLVRGVMDS